MHYDFSIWFNGVPTVEMAGPGDFSIWFNGVPTFELDYASHYTASAKFRRRASIAIM